MRVVFACVLLGLWVTLTGCATVQLFNPRTTYEEKTRDLRLSDADAQLVLVGEDYHYVLDVPESLRPVFHASYRPMIRWSFSWITVSKDQAVKLGYLGELDERLVSQQEKDAALVDGFIADKYGNVRISGELSGRREDEVVLPTTMTSIWSEQPRKSSSRIRVSEERSTTKRVFLMTLVPVAVVLDGVAVVTTTQWVVSFFGVGNFGRTWIRAIGANVARSGFSVLTGGRSNPIEP